jgi:iron uptake system component EfeO
MPLFTRTSLRCAAVLALATTLALGAAACSDDTSDSGSDATEAGSDATVVDAAALASAIESYRSYVIDQVDQMQTDAKVLTDAVRAGDLAAAQAAYAPSRQTWERIEPVAGLVEELDGKLDARVDDFEGEDDPDFTGWHRIEFILFDQQTTQGAAPFADQLDDDLQTLADEITEVDFDADVVAVGPSELIAEVSEGKITGEEDRYSGTDLWDFAANVEGADEVMKVLRPLLQEADPELLADIDDAFDELEGELAPYADGEGWKPYATLTESDKEQMQASLGQLAELLAEVPGALGLG